MKDRYEIRSRIGIGGHGVIYEAYDSQMQRKVAIKRLNKIDPSSVLEEGSTVFERETKTLSSLSHPNIIKIFDADEDDDGFYLVMELLKGQSLMEFVKENKPVALNDFLEFAVQSLDALTAARQVNILHRDIKPTNLFLERTPAGRLHVTLLDFGLAKFAETSDEQTRNADETVMGSVHFMAPEQFEMLPLDHRTDLYSFGVCCYYMLTGLYPFDGDSAPLIMAAHLQHRVVPLSQRRPDLPRPVAEWVHHLVARQPQERPNGSLAALEALLAVQPLSSSRSQPVAVSAAGKEKGKKAAQDKGSGGKVISRRRLQAGFLGVALVGGVAAYVMLATPAGEEGEMRVREWFGQFFSAVGDAENPAGTATGPEGPVSPPEMGQTEPVTLPELDTWTKQITEPGSELALDEGIFSPLEGSVSSLRFVDGVGANLFPELSLNLEPQKTQAVRWAFDLRMEERNPGMKVVMDELWGASLRSGPEGKALVEITISPGNVFLSHPEGRSGLSLVPKRWYRLEMEVNLAAGTHSASLMDLDREGSEPVRWEDLPLPKGAAEGGVGVVGTIRFQDRTEKTFRPNHTMHIDNVRLELGPYAE